jgi:predicted ATPase
MPVRADAAKAEAHFERALGIAREQQARSWELRAAMSMARLWRDQGNPQQAHDLLAPRHFGQPSSSAYGRCQRAVFDSSLRVFLLK